MREWYKAVFNVNLDVIQQGIYAELITTSVYRDTNVRLNNSGRGLSHILPVIIFALTAEDLGPGVDIIEHPEAELHPAAHASVADFLLSNIVGDIRPLVIETHSEMLLLRARRWVAEKRISPEDVLIYWINNFTGNGSSIQKIRILSDGQLENWPEGVFIEDYEEILAIHRAARTSL